MTDFSFAHVILLFLIFGTLAVFALANFWIAETNKRTAEILSEIKRLNNEGDADD